MDAFAKNSFRLTFPADHAIGPNDGSVSCSGRKLHPIPDPHFDWGSAGERERDRALLDIQNLSIGVVVDGVNGARPVAPLVAVVRLRP